VRKITFANNLVAVFALMTTAARRASTTGSASATPTTFKLIEELILLYRL